MEERGGKEREGERMEDRGSFLNYTLMEIGYVRVSYDETSLTYIYSFLF